MQRACAVCDKTIAAVAPQVQPGATMLELVEEVEHQMRLHGSRVASFTTHAFTHFVGGKNSDEETRTDPIVEGDVVMFDFASRIRRCDRHTT
jgi:Xaa-Pro aminopeptidase